MRSPASTQTEERPQRIALMTAFNNVDLGYLSSKTERSVHLAQGRRNLTSVIKL
jgi:hypothetical protein